VASQGPLYPTASSQSSDGHALTWTNLSNIGADDAAHATSTPVASSGNRSEFLRGTGLGFSLPDGALVNGIYVEIEVRCDQSAGGSTVVGLGLLKAGSPAGTHQLVGQGIAASGSGYKSAGGSTDLWGTTWTKAEVEAAGFGVELAVICDSGVNYTFTVDYFRVTVYYTDVGNFAGGVAPAGSATMKVATARSGAVTPGGALLNEPGKALSGSIATISGALSAPSTEKSLSAAVSPAGAVLKLQSASRVGVLTPTGALVRQPELFRTGSAALAGAVVREPGKILTAGIFPTGSYGPSKTGKVLAGTLAPAGAALRSAKRLLAGELTPTGALLGELAHAFTGAVAGAGAVVLKSGRFLSGSATTAGALMNTAKRLLAGGLTPAGTLGGAGIRRALDGSVVLAGTLAHKAGKLTTGAVATLVGSYGPSKVGKVLTGGETPSGSFVGKFSLSSLALTSFITPTGALTEKLSRALTGAASPTGALTKNAMKPFTGSIASASDQVLLNAKKVLEGAVQPAATIFFVLGRQFEGALGPTGTLAKHFPSMNFGGNVASAGSLVKKISTAFTASITPTGVGYVRPLKPLFALVEHVVATASFLAWHEAQAALVWVTGKETIELDPPAEGKIV
jgi:hypothetical protein